MKAGGGKYYIVGNRAYEVVLENKDGYNYEAFRERYSDVLERYDYIVGDWGYNMLRLKGFFKENHPKASKESSIGALQDYVNEYCNFGCAYFVVEKLAGKPEGEYISEPDTGAAAEHAASATVPGGINLNPAAAAAGEAAVVKGVGTLMRGDLPMRYNRTGVPARVSVNLAERKERAAARAESAAAARQASKDEGGSADRERRPHSSGGAAQGDRGGAGAGHGRGGDRQQGRDRGQQRQQANVSNGGYGRAFGERPSGGERSPGGGGGQRSGGAGAHAQGGGGHAGRGSRKERAAGGAPGRPQREGPRPQSAAAGGRPERGERQGGGVPRGGSGGRERWNGPRGPHEGGRRGGPQSRGGGGSGGPDGSAGG